MLLLSGISVVVVLMFVRVVTAAELIRHPCGEFELVDFLPKYGSRMSSMSCMVFRQDCPLKGSCAILPVNRGI